jgi:epoxyqueuosine reductase
MIHSDNNNLSVLIKEQARKIGFDLCGIASARVMTENGEVIKNWCQAGMNAGMSYLERNIEKRINPEYLLTGVKSLVVTGLSYYSEIRQKDPLTPVLSRYAYGANYHGVIAAKLEKLLSFIKNAEPETDGRFFVDSAPLLEKPWAREAGLGWQGKHSVVINKRIGSFFFIGILMLNKDLDCDQPVNDHCGTCRMCIDQCPTGAINDNRTIDARKCIANLTIENRGPIPEDIIPKLGGRVYGCDRCQEVCPWNKHIESAGTPEFAINEEVASMNREEWLSLTEEQYLRLFRDTALERVKYPNLMRNISAAIKSMDYQR